VTTDFSRKLFTKHNIFDTTVASKEVIRNWTKSYTLIPYIEIQAK